MKNTYISLIALFLVFLGIQSCTEDDLGGLLYDERANFLESYEVTEHPESDPLDEVNYNVTVDADENVDDRILIGNFFNSGANIYATFSNGSLTIPQQNFGSGYSVKDGMASISKNYETISVSYSIDQDNNEDWVKYEASFKKPIVEVK